MTSDAAALRDIVMKAESELAPPCEARIWHGPGHQSSTRCEVRGVHDVHAAVYGEFNQYGEWRDDKVYSGVFDEPPRVEQ